MLDPDLVRFETSAATAYADIITLHPDLRVRRQDRGLFHRAHSRRRKFATSWVGRATLMCATSKTSGFIHIKASDLMTLPEGIYHRFTCDSDEYIHAMRLFKGCLCGRKSIGPARTMRVAQTLSRNTLRRRRRQRPRRTMVEVDGMDKAARARTGNNPGGSSRMRFCPASECEKGKYMADGYLLLARWCVHWAFVVCKLCMSPNEIFNKTFGRLQQEAWATAPKPAAA